MIGQTLWSMSREEYEQRFGKDDCDYCKMVDEFRPLRFPLLIDDAEIEKALQEDDAERELDEEEKLANIDWFGITRSFG
jgi:hypothetical protein